MFNRAGRSNSALAVVVIAATTLLFMSCQREERVGREPEPNQPGQEQIESPVDPAIPPVRSSIEEQACADAEQSWHGDPDYYEKRDLCAQFLNAVATKNAAGLATWQTGIGVAGLIAVLITLWFNIRATNAAAQAARAAEISANATHNAERAWLFLSSVNAVQMHETSRDNELLGFAFKMEWENNGNTPAMDVNVFTRIKLLEHGEEPPIPQATPGAPEEVPNIQPAVIGPKSKFTIGSLTAIVPVDELVRVANGGARLCIWGYIEYRTVFDIEAKRDPKRWTGICILVETIGGPENLRRRDLPASFFSYAAVRHDAD